MTATRITLSVDDLGRCYGFTPLDEDGDAFRADAFGRDSLEGSAVTLEDGRSGWVEKVYGYIQTGPSGDSNYVAVDIEIESAD